jgi:type II secretory pathway pseudopilin PulG
MKSNRLIQALHIRQCAKMNGAQGNMKRGSALIGMITAIVMLSVIAAAIVPMVSSLGQQTAVVDQAAKAYYLAESGYRLAVSRFLHAGARLEDQHQTLEALDGNYTMDGIQGRFELKTYAYFYEILNDTLNGATSLKAHCPGSFPGPGALPDAPNDQVSLAQGLKVRIVDNTYTLDIASQAVSSEDDNVTLTFDTPLPFLAKGTVIYPVATANESQTPTLTNGGNLYYDTGSAAMFPLRNGKIRIDDQIWTYRFNDRDNNRLVDVQNPADTAATLALSPDAEITLMRYVRLHATGQYGDDALGIRRRVVYFAQLPLEGPNARSESFTDRFDTDNDWAAVTGTHAVGDIGDDSVLKVEEAISQGDDQGSLIQFNPSSEQASQIDFDLARRATRGYLAYEAQIKIGYEETPRPALSYAPYRPIPAHVAAGLSFRLSGTDTGDATSADLFESNGYGISFLRGNDTLDSGIPNEIIPLPDTRMMVLWQQTANGAHRNWLAYKELPVAVDWSDDFEGASAWEKEPQLDPANLWNPVSRPDFPYSGSGAWHFGREVAPGVFTYQPENADLTPRGGLQSDPLTLCDAPQVTLTFMSWHRTEDAQPARDRKQVRILVDGAERSNSIITRDGDETYWFREHIDVTEFSGQTIQVLFHFDAVDNEQNDFAGWMIDDVEVLCEEWPLNNATLAVRLQEAMVVHFTDGHAEIRQGDRILGGLRRTMGTVMGAPILSNGSWGGTPAASGALLLNRTEVVSTGDAFEAGEAIHVIGATGEAVVESWDEAADRKANVIQLFYANANGFGDGDTDPMNPITRPYGRLGIDPELTELQWPPELDGAGSWTDGDGNWTATEDYFRLVQWDALNDANVTDLKAIEFFDAANGQVDNAIVQSHNDTLQTPDFPSLYEEPELGLHAFGDGSENVFFDDFGIRLNVAIDDVLLAPLQQ